MGSPVAEFFSTSPLSTSGCLWDPSSSSLSSVFLPFCRRVHVTFFSPPRRPTRRAFFIARPRLARRRQNAALFSLSSLFCRSKSCSLSSRARAPLAAAASSDCALVSPSESLAVHRRALAFFYRSAPHSPPSKRRGRLAFVALSSFKVMASCSPPRPTLAVAARPPPGHADFSPFETVHVHHHTLVFVTASHLTRRRQNADVGSLLSLFRRSKRASCSLARPTLAVAASLLRHADFSPFETVHLHHRAPAFCRRSAPHSPPSKRRGRLAFVAFFVVQSDGLVLSAADSPPASSATPCFHHLEPFPRTTAPLLFVAARHLTHRRQNAGVCSLLSLFRRSK